LNEQDDFTFIPTELLNGDIELEEMHVSGLAGEEFNSEAVPEQETADIVETK